jgi:hypothetical protein
MDGGIQGPPPSSSNPLTANIYILKGDTHIETTAHDYRMPNTIEKGKEVENPSIPLQFEKMMGKTMTHILKGVFKKSLHNPNARASQNYSVVEDFSQTPCVMYALDVLQRFPLQRKALLVALGSTDTCNPGMIMLDTIDLKPRLPYHVVFHIVVAHPTKSFTWNIFHMVVDEGASTCVMLLACWKAIGQPILFLSPTLLTAFNSRSFRPHGIIPSFHVQLGGKTMCIEVEVVNAPLDYNLLLERSWTYDMHAVVATVFRVLLFPHEGQIMTINQFPLFRPDPSSGASTILMFDNPQLDVVNMGVGLFPLLMGTFDHLPPSGGVNMISVVPDQPRDEIFQVLSFRTNYFNDLWTVPFQSASMEGTRNIGMSMPLSVVEVVYSIVQQASINPNPTPTLELDPVLEPIWAQDSLATTDSLDLFLPYDEVILEALTGSDTPWDDIHHRSYFLLELRRIEVGEFMLTMTGDRSCPINPLAMHVVYAKGNMETISKTIPIDISRTPSVVENVFVGADCSPKDI